MRLTPSRRRHLEGWKSLVEPDLSGMHAPMRFVAVDVESSGLNPRSDRLIAIGAVALSNSRLACGESFYAVLRQESASSDDNILLHGIGGTAQIAGEEPAEALLRFLDFIGKSPLIGFHARFDEIMIDMAASAHLGHRFKRVWIDLASLAPALFPERAGRLKDLDGWTSEFRIANVRRHDALADAFATAQLFQVMQHEGMTRGMRCTRDLLEAARAQEWIDTHKP